MQSLRLPTLAKHWIYPRSPVERDGTQLFLAREKAGGTKLLGVLGGTTGFKSERSREGEVCFYELSAANAIELRRRLPELKPSTLGLPLSVGFGDRLGMATPGHVRAIGSAAVFPIFAQQSVRENARTGRSPQQVLDDACWGVFQAGWRLPWGADADHLKQPKDVQPFVEAGYTFFTVDPGDHVDNSAHSAGMETLTARCETLPWDDLRSSLEQQRAGYSNRVFQLPELAVGFDEATLLRAVAKYGRALAHVVRMYRHLCDLKGNESFDFEVSVDETETPTSFEEHYWISSELRRLGVRWVSLAPRFVGRFEKGVDYVGDLGELEKDLAGHCAVARSFGNYRLSLHSGSDKLSVYPILSRLSGGLAHIKTAGTSYLEALRTLASEAPDFFREILDFSRDRYGRDRATYHVSAEVDHVPDSKAVSQDQLPLLLDQFDAREVLHVTYGSVLDTFGAQLRNQLEKSEDRYLENLEAHFRKHLNLWI